MRPWCSVRRRAVAVLAGLSLAAFATAGSQADDKKPHYPKPPSGEHAKIIPDAWKTAPTAPATAAEIDRLLAASQRAEKITPSPLTTDEQFIRRAMLDLTGRLPLPADVEEFVASKATNKRSQLIDKLLDSEAFCKHWGKYWHDVIVSRATDGRIKRGGLTRSFETWLADQVRVRRNWGEIATAMMTASGQVKYNGEGNNETAASVYLLCHSGAEAAVERAAETSRVFLGIQIQCAQCHDHPSDMWKRNQFHELTAFYSRVSDRLVRDTSAPAGQIRFLGVELVSRPRGEHQMPGQDDPKKITLTHPRFLTGETIARGSSDETRRKALADFVTSKENYWFSAAFANRVWGELMGQGFYQPVDNMGPLQQATYPEVLLSLAAHFRNSNYDIRDTYRIIMNTEAYQRQTRLGESVFDHLHFAALYPKKLSADALWESLNSVLGQMQLGQQFRPQGPGARFAGRFGLEGQFKETFEYDPSTRSDEIEGSVPQALMLMNNPQINQKVRANGDTILARILNSHSNNDDALKMLYLRTLARKPTTRELETCREHIAGVGSRGEAFEDILWSLINSTEFQTKR